MNSNDHSGIRKNLSGKKLLITAGPCREPIDPVRFISNRSSGKMGYALAKAGIEAGAQVTLISGPVALKAASGVKLISIETTEQMYEAVQANFDQSDCLIMAAAPSDFIPVSIATQKIKKGAVPPEIKLQPAVDILKSLKGKKKKGQLVVGFALETENGIENASKKLIEKELDLIILNEITETESAFDSDNNRVTLIRTGFEPELWPLDSKEEISRRLLDYLVRLW